METSNNGNFDSKKVFASALVMTKSYHTRGFEATRIAGAAKTAQRNRRAIIYDIVSHETAKAEHEQDR